jgi:hypothetical protein
MTNEKTTSEAPDRKSGRVDRIGSDFGFIASDEVAGPGIYFKTSWFRGTPALRKGDLVTFELKSFGDRLQAHRLARPAEEDDEGAPPASLPTRGVPTTDWLLNWAYLGFIPNTLADLARLALRERWEFKDSVQNPERPLPILHGYLLHTFGRLVLTAR